MKRLRNTRKLRQELRDLCEAMWNRNVEKQELLPALLLLLQLETEPEAKMRVVQSLIEVDYKYCYVAAVKELGQLTKPDFMDLPHAVADYYLTELANYFR